LSAGSTVEVPGDDCGFRLPGREIFGQGGSEKGNKRGGRSGGDVHRPAIRPHKKRCSADHLAEFNKVEAADEGEHREVEPRQDIALPGFIGGRAHQNNPDSRRLPEELDESGEIFDAPVPEDIAGADVKDDSPADIKAILGPQILNLFFLSGKSGGKLERRRLGNGDTEHPDEVEVIFHAVDGRASGKGSRQTDMIIETLVFKLVSDFKTSAAEKSDLRGSRATVKINEGVILYPAKLEDEAHEGEKLLVWRQADDRIEMGVSVDEAAIGLFDDVGEVSVGERFLESGHGGCGHNHIADAPKTDEEDFFDGREVNPWSFFPAQWWPRR